MPGVRQAQRRPRASPSGRPQSPRRRSICLPSPPPLPGIGLRLPSLQQEMPCLPRSRPSPRRTRRRPRPRRVRARRAPRARARGHFSAWRWERRPHAQTPSVSQVSCANTALPRTCLWKAALSTFRQGHFAIGATPSVLPPAWETRGMRRPSPAVRMSSRAQAPTYHSETITPGVTGHLRKSGARPAMGARLFWGTGRGSRLLSPYGAGRKRKRTISGSSSIGGGINPQAWSESEGGRTRPCTR